MDTPKPRSYGQILSDMIDTFTSKAKIERLKVGNPILTIMEAAAQSDLRSTQDIFNFLASLSLDDASGQALDLKAKSAGIVRLPARSSSGFVNLIDTSITKIVTSIYQGLAAPKAGDTTVNIVDATLFPPSGSVYLGRNTANYEGPLAYSSKVNNTNYWTLNLTGSVSIPHNVGESVILAQGETRTVPAGTTVSTPSGITNSISFTTINQSQIQDGESEVDNIEVIASQVGVSGNVPSNSIKQVTVASIPGLTVTNPVGFTNGAEVESDTDLRERVRKSDQSKAKGTDLALETSVIGATADGKTVVSSKIKDNTLFIDDGTGYEETFEGVPSETLVWSAQGGEDFFELAKGRPVAGAFVKSTMPAPYALTDGSKLSVLVGSELSEHTFDLVDFSNISAATAFEVESSINGNSNLLFNAKTIDNGTGVIIFSKNNKEITVEAPSLAVDANTALGFPTSTVYTLHLFKNDKLLYQDGLEAIVTSQPQGSWSPTITSGDTLSIKVDGTPIQSVAVVDNDFIVNNTGYNSVSPFNALDAWATVLNTKVAGCSFTVNGDKLQLASNLGASSRAALSISGGSLVAKGMFLGTESVSGINNDYSLNVNTGQINLVKPLSAGDTLTAGTINTNAFIESPSVASGTVTFAGQADFYLLTDGAPTVVSTGLNSSIALTLTEFGGAGSHIARYTAGSSVFGNLAVGDWLVLIATTLAETGFWRINQIDPGGTWFEVERTTITGATGNFTNFAFIRSAGNIQKISIPAAAYSLINLASQFNSQLIGATAYVNKTKLRLATNTYSGNGDITLIGQNSFAAPLGLTSLLTSVSYNSLTAFKSTSNSDRGTPDFRISSVASTGAGLITYSDTIFPQALSQLSYIRRQNDSNTRYSTIKGHTEVISDFTTSSTFNYRSTAETVEKVVGDQFVLSNPFAISPRDQFSVTLDQDSTNKNYSIDLFRELKPQAAATYGNALFEVRENSNGNSLFSAFGTTTSFFNDFAVYFQARGKSHSTTANKTILWKYKRLGPEGERVAISLDLPQAPNQLMSYASDMDNGYGVFKVRFASGAQINPTNLLKSHKFVDTYLNSYAAPAASITRAANVVTVTLGPAGVVSHTLVGGDQVFQSSAVGSFPAGFKKVTGTTQNTFTYNENGINDTQGSVTYVASAKAAGTKLTITALSWNGGTVTATIGAHNFNVGDFVTFLPGHVESGVVLTNGSVKLVSVAATTVSWNDPLAIGIVAATLVPGVDYTISEGACARRTLIEATHYVPVGGLVRAGNVVTATITFVPIVTSLGVASGDIIYLNSPDANFSSGYKTLTSVSGNVITYNEPGAAVASVLPATFRYNISTVNFGGVSGSVVNIKTDSSIFNRNIIATVSGSSASSIEFFEDLGFSTGNQTPRSFSDLNHIQFYPLTPTTALSLSNWVNSNISTYLSATLVNNNGGGSNDGSASISSATIDEWFNNTTNSSFNGTTNRSGRFFYLFDGVNAIKACNVSNINSQLQLKYPVNQELAANNDFANEVFRISPVNSPSISRWLNSSATSAIYNNITAMPSNEGGTLEIVDKTTGDAGAIQVANGTSNSVIVYTLSKPSSFLVNGESIASKIEVPSGSVDGLVGNSWVTLENQVLHTKTVSTLTGATSTVAPLTTTSSISFNTDVVSIVNLMPLAANSVIVRNCGKFTSYTNLTVSAGTIGTSIASGDWVVIKMANANVKNIGIKRVVEVDVDKNTFWIEGSGIEETINCVVGDFWTFVGNSKFIPGDKILVKNNSLGALNDGSFVISDLLYVAGIPVTTGFVVNGVLSAGTNTVSNANDLLGQESVSVKIWGKTRGIYPVTSSGNFAVNLSKGKQIYTRTGNNLELIEAGATLEVLDKLGFDTGISVGNAAYQHSIGLVEEANKIVYGDEGNSFAYPGVHASGTLVNIRGPLVKRIKLGLGVRISTTNTADIISKVKNSVASLINGSKIGESIAFSDIIAMAGTVSGIDSVVPLSPIYDSVNDKIVLQANEKARVLDVENDISISLIG